MYDVTSVAAFSSVAFSSVGSLTALKADHLAKDNNWTLDSNAYETFNVSSVSEQFEFQPVSENDVANVILNLPSNKAPGFDKVPARILKDVRANCFCASLLRRQIHMPRHATSCIECAR